MEGRQPTPGTPHPPPPPPLPGGGGGWGNPGGGGGGRVNQPKAPEGWGFPQGESQPPSPLPVSAGLCPALPMWPGAWRDPPDKPNLTVGARGRQGASGLRRGGPRTPGHQGWKRFGHLGSQGWPCFSHLPGRKGRQQGRQVPWLDGPVSTTPGSAP